MRDILVLDRYPLDKPGSPQWQELVRRCRADLKAGKYTQTEAVSQAATTAARAQLWRPALAGGP